MRRTSRPPRRSRPRDHEPEIELWTELNVPLRLVPRLWRMAMQTTTIRASITAYSTAVGPSSLAMNRMILASFRNIGGILLRYGWRRIGRRTRRRDRTSLKDRDEPTRDRLGAEASKGTPSARGRPRIGPIQWPDGSPPGRPRRAASVSATLHRPVTVV